MPRATRTVQQSKKIDDTLAKPFTSDTEIPELRWPPDMVYAQKLARICYKEYLDEHLSDEQVEVRGGNFLYRLAFPQDRIGYPEALERALNGDDETLFNLVRLFGREAEKSEWFLHREARAYRERDVDFLRRHNAARQTRIDWQKHKQSVGRLILLSIFEPELREQKPKYILAFLREWHDAGRLPGEDLPSLGALRKYLTTRLGW